MAVVNVIGWRCLACGTTLPIDTVMPWRCPAAGEDRSHVLAIERTLRPLRPTEEDQPFLAFDGELAWAAFADARGMDLAARRALVCEVDAAVEAIAGAGFRRTPFTRRARLSAALGFDDEGGVWVKDETGAVGGSHKARHLMTVLLHLMATERLGLAPWTGPAERPPLAISSCGNAAIAAATLASAVSWPLDVFVPTWASGVVVDELERLGARIQRCPRREEDPPGDPCVLRFREAVAAGSLPFSVQGPENALCLDGGRTLFWEMYEVLGAFLDRVFVQVGGGAFAASIASARTSAGVHPRFHAVQTAACAPLVRAWERAVAGEGPRRAGVHPEWMAPWERVGTSAADGILDDEAYDWVPILGAMADDGGSPVVVRESMVLEAHRLAVETTGCSVSPTGTAGLAGLLAIRHEIDPGERVAVVFSGVAR